MDGDTTYEYVCYSSSFPILIDGNGVITPHSMKERGFFDNPQPMLNSRIVPVGNTKYFQFVITPKNKSEENFLSAVEKKGAIRLLRKHTIKQAYHHHGYWYDVIETSEIARVPDDIYTVKLST